MCYTNSTGFERDSLSNSTEQDAVTSSLMAIDKKVLNGPSCKCQSETVMSTSRVALSQLPTV